MSELSRRDLLTGSAAAAGILAMPSISEAVQATTSPLRRPKLKITDVRTAEDHRERVRTVTDAPGIGVGMDEAAARKAQAPNTPWFAPNNS